MQNISKEMSGMTVTDKYATLKSGSKGKMPLIGFGTWQAAPGEVGEAVKAYVKAGGRHIDCAAIYFNEKEIGDALKELFSSGVVKREELWITSKLWCTHHEPDKVPLGLEATLRNLQCDYLDLYLVHWPLALKHTGEPLSPSTAMPRDPKTGDLAFEKVSLQQTWHAMEALPITNVRHIGISNYPLPLVVDLLTYCNVRPAVHQVEVHPYNSRFELLGEMRKLAIHVTAYSPLGSGVAKNELFNDPAIKAVAASHNATPAQVILSWLVAQGVSVIPKSTNPDRIKQNLACQVPLTEGEVKAVGGLNRNLVVCDVRKFWNYPFHTSISIV